MTAIAVKRNKDNIEISADTEVTMSMFDKMTTSTDRNMKNFSKLYQINDIVAWFAWAISTALFASMWIKTNNPKGNRIDDMTEYILDMYKHLKEVAPDTDIDAMQSIIIYQNKIFCAIWYLIFEVEEYASIWSGMPYCHTAMYLGQSTKQAVWVAIEFAQWVWWAIETITIPIKDL